MWSQLSRTCIDFFRILQGISSAMLQATAMSLLMSYTDKEHHAKVFALFGVLISMGPLLGPVIGGFILTVLNWRYLFWINLPICIYAIAACRHFAPEKKFYMIIKYVL